MTSNVYEWISEDKIRENILVSMTQPLTAKQISRKTGISKDTCSYLLSKFAAKDIIVCLNPCVRNSRLYWVTDFGEKCQRHLCPDLPESTWDLPSVNWELYGWVCYNHRAAVIRVLTKPMQPSEMKRKLRQIGSDVKISANNIRDIIRLFHKNGIVRQVSIRKKAHPRYKLTEQGIQIQKLLNQARIQL